MGKSENSEATEKAVSMLSEDNRRWLASWIKEGWAVYVSEDLEWIGTKFFDGDERVFALDGFQNFVLLMTAIEAEEHSRRIATLPEDEKPSVVLDYEKICLACGAEPVGKAGFCVPCTSPGIEFGVPNEAAFDEALSDYLVSPEMAQIAERLIATYPEDLWEINRAQIEFLWKRKGSESHGRAVLGKIKKTAAELAWYSKKDYLVIVAADFCRYFNGFELTALVFHELKHGRWDHEKMKFGVVGHDFEGFRREVELFGYWKPDIKRMAEAFAGAKQLELFETAQSVIA